MIVIYMNPLMRSGGSMIILVRKDGVGGGILHTIKLCASLARLEPRVTS
jgi:hypothetical protein